MQRKLISVAKYAELRGLNRSTINRQIKDGKIGTVQGLIDPEQADRDRERNLDPCRREQAARRKEDKRQQARPKRNTPRATSPAEVIKPADALQIAIDVLERAAAPEEVLKFCRIALAAGCTPEQAYVVSLQFASQPAVDLDGYGIEAEDLFDFKEPSRAEWRKLLGKDFDFDAADAIHDRISMPETIPPSGNPAA